MANIRVTNAPQGPQPAIRVGPPVNPGTQAPLRVASAPQGQQTSLGVAPVQQPDLHIPERPVSPDMLSPEKKAELASVIKRMEERQMPPEQISHVVKSYVRDNASIPSAQTASSSDVSTEKKPGFLGSVARGIFNLPARALVTTIGLAKGGAAALDAIGNKIVGNEAAAQDAAARGLSEMRSRHIPGLGEVQPIAFKAPGEGALRSIADAAGVGAEAASFAIGGPAVKGIFSQPLKRALAQGAKTGAQVGTAGGFGASLQQKDASLGSVASGTISGALGGAAGGVIGAGLGKAADTFIPKITRKLEETNLRLTPTQKTALGDKLNEVTEYLRQQKITGSPETRFEKVNQTYGQVEDYLQNFLKNQAKGKTIPRQKLIQDAEALKSSYFGERDQLEIEKQIDSFINLLNTKYPKDIPLTTINSLKRSTFKNAFNRAGDKVLDAVEYDLGDVMRNNLEIATNGMTLDGFSMREFNRHYGTLINARKLLKIAKGRNEVGFTGRIISGILGGGLASSMGAGGIGKSLAFGAGELAAQSVFGTRTRSAISAGLEATREQLLRPGTGATLGRVISNQ